MVLERITVYVKANQSVEISERKVTIGDIAEVGCANPHILPRIKSLGLFQMPDKGKHRTVISMLYVIEKIHEEFPSVNVNCIGATDVIVTYEEQKNRNKILQGMKVVAVVAITFVGAAFSIMTFTNDVDVPKLFSQIYEQVMGVPKTSFSILEIAYSIGIALGILIFFNHFGKKRFSVDPTPIEVEMRTYEDEIQNALIQKYDREGREQNVNQTNPSGSHRS